MRTITLSTLREDIRQRCDLPTFSTTTYVTTAAVNRQINIAIERLVGILQECQGDDYWTTHDQFTTTANANYIAWASVLTQKFIKLRKLIWVKSATERVELRKASYEEWDDFGANAGGTSYTASEPMAWTTRSPVYSLAGPGFYVWPVPSATYTLRAYYVYTPADVSGDNDTISVGPGWEEWLINDVSVALYQRQEKDPSVLIAERNDAEARIRKQAANRDQFAVQTVRDVWGDGWEYVDPRSLYARR